jgi:hypothetical protein
MEGFTEGNVSTPHTFVCVRVHVMDRTPNRHKIETRFALKSLSTRSDDEMSSRWETGEALKQLLETLGDTAFLALHPTFMLVLCTHAAEMRIHEASEFYMDCIYNFCSDTSKTLCGMSSVHAHVYAYLFSKSKCTLCSIIHAVYMYVCVYMYAYICMCA